LLTTTTNPAPDARLPRYQQLRDAVTSQIAAGVWKPGDAIPAEQALAETHGLALGTVRKALDALVAEGLLEKRQGKGTFVRRAEFSNSLFRFFRFHDAEGRQAIPEGRVLVRKRVAASPEAAARLGLAPGAPAIRLSRLRLVEGKPLLAEDIWLPAERFAALMELRPTEFSDLLYPLYEELCGQSIASAEESLSIEPVDAANARLLALEPGAPVVVIERVARGYDRQPLEWRRSRGPADRFHYRVEIR
jgi:GntR family transcriptional regulator